MGRFLSGYGEAGYEHEGYAAQVWRRQARRSAPESLASSPAPWCLEVVERVLGELHGVLELARELRESIQGDLQ